VPDPATIHPVILSGGAGTRLWPLSRKSRPKQFVSLSGDETMLQRTALRTAGRAGFAAPVVVAAADDGDAIEAQLAEVGIVPDRLILEPAARNTAAAIALAAADAGDEALLLVMPSDHEIGDVEAFHDAVAAARRLAAEDWLITFGVAPDRPETGYGYIRRGEPLSGPFCRADRFAEKPDAETAAVWLAEGGWCWNAGIFLFRAGAMLDLLATYAPDVLAAVRRSIGRASRAGGRLLPDPESFAASPSISIDKAVMEKALRVAVAPVEMHWSDVGSWEAVHALGPHDDSGNLVVGNAIALDSRHCLVRSEGPAVVALGVDDLVIVATERSVLVVPRGQTQRVKEAIDALEARKKR
jgi:mannose-1-phosphate guanylyltransferase/mannose-1-phosphate guanylyltransferase/mannose-6-phosphate isomerase